MFVLYFQQIVTYTPNAIAFVVDLCMGLEPANIRYDQSKMCSHLIQSFKNEVLTSFPSNAVQMMKPVKVFIKVFCTCRLPEFAKENRWHSVIDTKSGVTNIVKRFRKSF